MALPIFRFIPFSIPFRFPFRFPFRVLVTPLKKWIDQYLSKYTAHPSLLVITACDIGCNDSKLQINLSNFEQLKSECIHNVCNALTSEAN